MRVLLVPNVLNAAAAQATCELATWLSGQGLEPVLGTDDAVGLGLADFGVAPSDIGEPVLVVALGGDGTILKAVHLLGEVEVPVLGVKFGRLGFLSGRPPAPCATRSPPRCPAKRASSGARRCVPRWSWKAARWARTAR